MALSSAFPLPFTTLQSPMNPDREYEVLGFCEGVVVRGYNVLRQFISDLKSVFGANLGEMETIILRIRHEAIRRCIESASTMGADEVIGLTIDVSDISRPNADSLTIIHVYGTAIRYVRSRSQEGSSRKSRRGAVSRRCKAE